MQTDFNTYSLGDQDSFDEASPATVNMLSALSDAGFEFASNGLKAGHDMIARVASFMAEDPSFQQALFSGSFHATLAMGIIGTATSNKFLNDTLTGLIMAHKGDMSVSEAEEVAADRMIKFLQSIAMATLTAQRDPSGSETYKAETGKDEDDLLRFRRAVARRMAKELGVEIPQSEFQRKHKAN